MPDAAFPPEVREYGLLPVAATSLVISARLVTADRQVADLPGLDAIDPTLGCRPWSPGSGTRGPWRAVAGTNLTGGLDSHALPPGPP